MCKGINRSLGNVLLGGFGVDAGAAPAGGAPALGGTHTEITHDALAMSLIDAKKIVIVPGYGLAVARAQQKLQELVLLAK